jgi:hypothetical protein
MLAERSGLVPIMLSQKMCVSLPAPGIWSDFLEAISGMTRFYKFT